MQYLKRPIALTLLAVFLTASGVAAMPSAIEEGSRKITLEEARKIALKRVPGTVDEEFAIEDEDGKVTDYIFYVKDKNGKVWEIQIEAEKGEIISAEMQDEEGDTEDPPADEEPPNFFAMSAG